MGEAQRTMLTEATTDAVLVIESINKQVERANLAMDELKYLIDTYFNIESTMKIFTEKDTSFDYQKNKDQPTNLQLNWWAVLACKLMFKGKICNKYDIM